VTDGQTDRRTDRRTDGIAIAYARLAYMLSRAKNDYRRTTSVSGLVRDLGWQSLEDPRKNSRLALFYKGLRGLSAIPCDSLRRPVRNSRHSDSDTFTILSSRLDCYKFSFFPRTVSEWNKLSQDARSKSSIVSFRSALLKPPGPVKNNF